MNMRVSVIVHLFTVISKLPFPYNRVLNVKKQHNGAHNEDKSTLKACTANIFVG